jgi:hypothetical protein
VTTTDIVPVNQKSTELATIDDTRPWHERVWDATGCDPWEQQVLEALRNGSIRTLVGLIEQLKVMKPATAARAKKGYAHIFHNIDPDIMARPAPRRRG